MPVLLMRRKRPRAARPSRHVSIGVVAEMRAWAISVDGADPLVIGQMDDSAASLVCAAANTLELSDRHLAAALVWGAGPRPRPSRTVSPSAFREVVAGDTARPADSLRLMAAACKELDAGAGPPG